MSVRMQQTALCNACPLSLAPSSAHRAMHGAGLHGAILIMGRGPVATV